MNKQAASLFPDSSLKKMSYGFVALCLAILSGFMTTAPAQAAFHQSTVEQQQYCQLVIAKPSGNEATSKVLSQNCANQPLQSEGGTLLMRLYTDAHFKGSSTTITGKDGPCDAKGYTISNIGSKWGTHVSSYRVYNNCNISFAYREANRKGACSPFQGDVPYVGSGLNDHLFPFHILSGKQYLDCTSINLL